MSGAHMPAAHAAHAAQLQAAATQQQQHADHALTGHHASLLTGASPIPSAGSGAGAAAAQGLTDYHDTERRSSSIAALRLKAREHTVAAMGMHGMGILSVYGAKSSM